MDFDYNEYRQELALLHQSYIDKVASGSPDIVKRGIFSSKNMEEYLQGTVYALGFRSPNDPKEEYQRWLRLHLLLGRENDGIADFLLNYRATEPANNPVLRALDAVPNITTMINISGTLNTMIYNISVIEKVRESLNNGDLRIINMLGSTMMVKNGDNYFLNLSLEFPYSIRIFDFDHKPFFHCTLGSTNGDHDFSYAEWRAPHYEHEVIRSSVMISKRHIGQIALDELGSSVDEILERANQSQSDPEKIFKTREERTFTFENHVAEFFESQLLEKRVCNALQS